MTKRRFTAKFDLPEGLVQRAANQRIELKREFDWATDRFVLTHAWCAVVRDAGGKFKQCSGFSSTEQDALRQLRRNTTQLGIPENRIDFKAITETSAAPLEPHQEVA